MVLGESQREAARRLGIPTYTLAALESGEKPRIASAARLVAAARVLYGVPVEAWLEQGSKERRRRA